MDGITNKECFWEELTAGDDLGLGGQRLTSIYEAHSPSLSRPPPSLHKLSSRTFTFLTSASFPSRMLGVPSDTPHPQLPSPSAVGPRVSLSISSPLFSVSFTQTSCLRSEIERVVNSPLFLGGDHLEFNTRCASEHQNKG